MMLSGKYAIVTGAARGIGAHIALALAETGAFVALLDRDEKGLRQTAKVIEGSKKKCKIFEVDLQHSSAI